MAFLSQNVFQKFYWWRCSDDCLPQKEILTRGRVAGPLAGARAGCCRSRTGSLRLQGWSVSNQTQVLAALLQCWIQISRPSMFFFKPYVAAVEVLVLVQCLHHTHFVCVLAAARCSTIHLHLLFAVGASRASRLRRAECKCAPDISSKLSERPFDGLA
jgi:hypothetical protein